MPDIRSFLRPPKVTQQNGYVQLTDTVDTEILTPGSGEHIHLTYIIVSNSRETNVEVQVKEGFETKGRIRCPPLDTIPVQISDLGIKFNTDESVYVRPTYGGQFEKPINVMAGGYSHVDLDERLYG